MRVPIGVSYLTVRARIFALLPLAALGVQGHAYLTTLTPILAFIAALLAAELLLRCVLAFRGRGSVSSRTRFAGLAIATAVTLVAIYALQETVEGLLETGHPDGLAGVFGEGGWWAVPLAIIFGAAIASFLRGADAAVAAIARIRRRPWRLAAVPGPPKPIATFLSALAPAVAGAPTRAPPLTAVSD